MKQRYLTWIFCLCAWCVVWPARAADWAQLMKQSGLVDIGSLCADIKVQLMYSTSQNFMGMVLYGDLEEAYFQPHFAREVIKAQKYLQQLHPGYTLLIYDAARPISVQRAMFQHVKGTKNEAYVADGTLGGRHNYGVAVDLTIAQDDGTPLDMGTPFDWFGSEAHVKATTDNRPETRTLDAYIAFVKQQEKKGILTHEQAQNRMLLLTVMCHTALRPYRCEWWHYEETVSMKETRKKYPLIDF